MLLIKTYLDKSPIQGVGVFANEFVKKGTPVWKFNPLIDIILIPEQLVELPEATREFIDSVAISYPYGSDNFCLSVDNANYMNHSDAPNVSSDTEPNIALRDIPKGTELTVDYYKEDHRTDESECQV
jgi:hypothetical protein